MRFGRGKQAQTEQLEAFFMPSISCVCRRRLLLAMFVLRRAYTTVRSAATRLQLESKLEQKINNNLYLYALIILNLIICATRG